MTLQTSPARPRAAIWRVQSYFSGASVRRRMDRGLMIGLAMFGDDQKTPPPQQPPAKAEDKTTAKPEEDADKDPYQFTDWALI